MKFRTENKEKEASIIFGKGVTSGRPGSTDGLVLAVDDIDAARADLSRVAWK